MRAYAERIASALATQLNMHAGMRWLSTQEAAECEPPRFFTYNQSLLARARQSTSLADGQAWSAHQVTTRHVAQLERHVSLVSIRTSERVSRLGGHMWLLLIQPRVMPEHARHQTTSFTRLYRLPLPPFGIGPFWWRGAGWRITGGCWNVRIRNTQHKIADSVHYGLILCFLDWS